MFLISDDRSIDVFRTRIETATQMREVLSTDYKPNCLLIDEVDGASAVIHIFDNAFNRILFQNNCKLTKKRQNSIFILRRMIHAQA